MDQKLTLLAKVPLLAGLDRKGPEEVGRLAPSALEAMTGWRDTLYVGAIMSPDSNIYWVKP